MEERLRALVEAHHPLAEGDRIRAHRRHGCETERIAPARYWRLMTRRRYCRIRAAHTENATKNMTGILSEGQTWIGRIAISILAAMRHAGRRRWLVRGRRRRRRGPAGGSAAWLANEPTTGIRHGAPGRPARYIVAMPGRRSPASPGGPRSGTPSQADGQPRPGAGARPSGRCRQGERRRSIGRRPNGRRQCRPSNPPKIGARTTEPAHPGSMASSKTGGATPYRPDRLDRPGCRTPTSSTRPVHVAGSQRTAPPHESDGRPGRSHALPAMALDTS